jgi:hypothetical protein
MAKSLFPARADTALAAPKTTQMKFRVAGPLSAMIDKAAAEHGWGASEEIRRRLAASFLNEALGGDDETRKLREAIQTVVDNVEPPFGAWHQNRFAFDVFRAAVLALLDLHRPAGDPVRPSETEIADLYLGEDGTPETAGRMLAGGAATAAGIPFPSQRLRQERK